MKLTPSEEPLILEAPPLTQRQYDIFVYTTISSNYKYISVCTGRQVGKTHLALMTMINWALEDSNTIGFFMPTYKQCKKVMRQLEGIVKDVPAVLFNRSDMTVSFKHNGSLIVFFTADNDNCRGETFDKIIVDEACFVKDTIWSEAIRPTVAVALSRGNGKVLLLSTPKRKNWFFDMVHDKTDGKIAFKFTTEEGGIVGKDEIADIKRSTPDRIFRCEYMAEFMDDGSGLFEWKSCVVKNTTYNRENKHYAAVDWGIEDDYTVLTIMDYKGQVVYINRWRGDDWQAIIVEIASVLRTYGSPPVHCETNGIGNMPTKELRKVYRDTLDWVTNAKNKNDMILKLAHDLKNNLITIPDDEQLGVELDVYTMTYNPSTGGATYGARNGFHDDMVMSLAICNSVRKSNSRNIMW